MSTIVDDFNRADSATTLGTTSDGTATWTAQSGTWGISSNQAYSPTIGLTPAWSVATVPGAADGTVQATFAVESASTAGTGLVFRCSDANNFWVIYAIPSRPAVTGLWQVVSGAFFRVGAAFAIAAGDVISVDTLGSSITPKVNGTAVPSTPYVGETFNMTAALSGLYAEATDVRLDDFSCTGPSLSRGWVVGAVAMN